MRSKVFGLLAFSVSAVISVLHLGATPAAAQQGPRFTITDLGDFGGNRGAAYDINRDGVVVGDARSPGQIPSAFRYGSVGIESLQVTGWTMSSATRINTNGDIIGTGFVSSPSGAIQKAFLRPASSFDWQEITLVNTPGGTVNGPLASLSDINDDRVLVGSASVQNNTPVDPTPGAVRNGSLRRAFKWHSNDGGFNYVETPLPTLGGDFNAAAGINNQGQIVGKSGLISGVFYPYIDYNACLWESNDGGASYVVKNLGMIPGGAESFASAINDAGVIVGVSAIDTNINPIFHACMWRTYDGGATYEVTDLGVLLPETNPAMRSSSALAVNDLGYVVGVNGYCVSGSDPCQGHAVIWVPGTGTGTGIFDLNTLVDNMPEGYVLVSATGINNSGQIVGEAVKIGNSMDTFAYRLDLVTPLVPACGTSDFNGDSDFGTDADIEAFFACLAGSCCQTCFIRGSDFNGDGDFGTDADIEAFFRVLSGGTC